MTFSDEAKKSKMLNPDINDFRFFYQKGGNGRYMNHFRIFKKDGDDYKQWIMNISYSDVTKRNFESMTYNDKEISFSEFAHEISEGRLNGSGKAIPWDLENAFKAEILSTMRFYIRESPNNPGLYEHRIVREGEDGDSLWNDAEYVKLYPGVLKLINDRGFKQVEVEDFMNKLGDIIDATEYDLPDILKDIEPKANESSLLNL